MDIIKPGVTADEYVERAKSRITITALQEGDIVYIRILKCASSFFHNNFQAWGWRPIAFDAIDWNRHHVFAHILDPLERRYKGIAEYIKMHNMQEMFFNNPEFKQFVSPVPVFDDHTASYYDQLGNYCRLIDWIPISGRGPEETIALTERLLYDHGIRILNRWNRKQARPATNELKKLQLAVRDCLAETYQDGVYRYLYNDCVLYDRVCAKFDPSKPRWAEVSWLR